MKQITDFLLKYVLFVASFVLLTFIAVSFNYLLLGFIFSVCSTLTVSVLFIHMLIKYGVNNGKS
jgi:hypothetical protein